MASKADLHLHSRYSDRSAEWLFRRFDFPDSCSDPRKLYDQLVSRGMSFITLTDHNRIDGCLEIAELPATFISEQVTTMFPEDRCPVHLLVWGITEAQHLELQQARENIYDLQRYLGQNGIAHAVAHPLYKLDDRLSPAHLQKLMLLFKCFEGLNGLRESLLGQVFTSAVRGLTREGIDRFANQHGLQPTHPEPWKKTLIGGSDDHGGIFAGCAWTETSAVADAASFLRCVSAGQCVPAGKAGSPLTLSHSLYNTGFTFLTEKLAKRNDQTPNLLEKAFSRFMEGRDPTEFTFSEKLNFLAQGITSGKIFELAKPANASIWRELSRYFSQSDVKQLLARETEGIDEPERRAFVTVNLFANQLAFRFFTKFVSELSSGKIIEAIQDIGTLAPLMLMLSPYIYAFHSQAPNRKWLEEMAGALTDELPQPLRNGKRAWFTDTLEDVNGVATTIQKMTHSSVGLGNDLVVVTSRMQIEITGIPIKNFQPIGEFELPEYELQKLSFPPILQIIDYIQREKFTEVIISTPGPIGITALLAAKMLGIRTSGIYHTDFPQYVRILTDDSFLETLTWKFMHWFYSQLDLIYVNSESYRTAWIDRGIPAEKLAILPRGLDTALFNPSRRDPEFTKKLGCKPGHVVLLYVGRVSKEKDLDTLAQAFRLLLSQNVPVELVMVGDGPYLPELRQTLPEAHYTGYLTGRELAVAYASADIFVFPSTTDTFGNVVLESLASGLPTVVSDTGGPKELIRDGELGYVTKSLDVGHFAAAVRKLVEDPELRARISRNAVASVQDRDWEDAARRFWQMSEK